MVSAILGRLNLGLSFLVGVFLFGTTLSAQNGAMAKAIDIVVQAVDGRSGKPLANQHLLVFTGPSSEAVKSHAEHTGLTTNKEGVGTLTIYPAETQWLQVWADGRILCQQDPNRNTFNVATIMSKGLAAPNTCSAVVEQPPPGHFIIYARPAHFKEKIRE